MLDLFAKWYVRDGEEFLAEMNNSYEEREPEGFLHGRAVNIDEDWDGSDETISPGSVGLGVGKVVGDTERVDEMGGCPFSGSVGGEAPHPMPVGSPNVEAK